MKYIQSFYQYPVTFSSIGKTIPSRYANGEMRNIAEFSEAEIERLKNSEPFFRELLKKNKIRILNHIPNSYIPPATQVNNARRESEELKSENEALKARIAELEAAAKSQETTASEAPKKAGEELESKSEAPKKNKKK